ncbi:MAG: sulfate transporter family protein [Beijerinckiaceae bacterium]|nr:sulfate transporter family protein [Beijerinckiaceae bacterium]
MFETALAAASQIFTPPFRNVLWKTLALTLALLSFAGIALHKIIMWGVPLSGHWAAALSLVSGAGLVAGLVFLIAPVSFIVAGFFFDELAEAVEREAAPGEVPGRALALGDALWLSVKFSALALAVNFAALLLLLVPGLNAAAFFGANAYLSGRGYFELAASRHLSFGEMHKLRKMNEFRLFGAGLFISALLAIPLVNLLTPLFAAAFMVRISRNIINPARTSSRPALK